MGKYCSFQNPTNGWWTTATYDEDKKTLTFEPMDDMGSYIQLFEEGNERSMTAEEKESAEQAYQSALKWCQERQSIFFTVKKANEYLQELTDDRFLYLH